MKLKIAVKDIGQTSYEKVSDLLQNNQKTAFTIVSVALETKLSNSDVYAALMKLIRKDLADRKKIQRTYFYHWRVN